MITFASRLSLVFAIVLMIAALSTPDEAPRWMPVAAGCLALFYAAAGTRGEDR